MNLYYRNVEVTPDMYCLEWYDSIFEGKDNILNYLFFLERMLIKKQLYTQTKKK